MGEVTVGIDIGTTSVKAVAADADGQIVARARVPHEIHIPEPDLFTHDAEAAWARGPTAALAQLGDVDPVGVSVAAMIPSLVAVDDSGTPITPGLLYGDARGRAASGPSTDESGEFREFLAWTAAQAPDAHGYWPAQSVANYALSGSPILDTTTAVTAHPLFDFVGWDEGLLAEVGARPDQLPTIAPSGQPAGHVVQAGDAVLEPGTIDALAEQFVAGADSAGDVLVICGTTLIVWAVVESEREVPGYLCVPHTTSGLWLVGGPSNAGGLFLDWARRLLGARGRSSNDQPVDPPADSSADPSADPSAVPVWAPYLRGERAPLHNPDLRGELVDLDLTHGTDAVLRAAFEASGFAVRRLIEAAGLSPNRIVATGGGTRVDGWMQALADTTALPVDASAVPEGGALGAAFLARVAAGLEAAATDASRWARTGRQVEPDPRWTEPTAQRYERFAALVHS